MSAAEVPAATGAGTLDRAALRAPLVALARRAGEAILAVYARDFGVEAKADRSPLTEADLASHRVLVAGLGTLAPGIPVLSEESPASEVAGRRRWRRLWLIDPLDGTREFVKKNGEFCVCIALVEDGVPVLGVVHAPVGDTGWSALAGEGVWKHGPEGREQRLAPRPASVTPPTLAGLRVAASRSHLDVRTAALLERLPGAERVALGSALKFGLLAEGRLDLYPRFGPTSEWDTAAGQCLVEAMGGAVLDLEGRPLRYNQRDTLINGDFLALSDPRLPWESLLD